MNDGRNGRMDGRVNGVSWMVVGVAAMGVIAGLVAFLSSWAWEHNALSMHEGAKFKFEALENELREIRSNVSAMDSRQRDIQQSVRDILKTMKQP